MKNLSSFIVLSVCICLSACALMPAKSDIQIAPVSEVLNAVKDELNAYLATKPSVPITKGICNRENAGNNNVDLVPTAVTLTLQTATAQTSSPSVGLLAPIGVISFDPSYSGAYSRSRTQTLQVPLKVDATTKPQPVTPGEHPIAKAIAEFRDELLKVNHDKTPCLSAEQEIILTIAFDVVNKSTGGFALKLAFLSIGDKETLNEEAHQKLEMKFKFAGGSWFLLYKDKDKVREAH
ncbi:MAG TPA: hypothetical protein PKZ12_07330 [Smithellaceae bacterium]|nr:hypothetical protein [Smithellaceae bacterium]